MIKIEAKRYNFAIFHEIQPQISRSSINAEYIEIILEVEFHV